MRCAECGDEIKGKPVKQDGELYCSLECAYLAAGFDPDDEDDYFEEDPVEGSFDEDEE